ncbi:hypothetical protein NORO109296_05810 [Nocardiopsis rhodophaea]
MQHFYAFTVFGLIPAVLVFVIYQAVQAYSG